MLSAALLLVGFGAGLLVAGSGTPFERTAERGAEGKAPAGPPQDTESPVEEIPLPSNDVGGLDIRGLPRYPGSVRVEYRRQKLGGFVITEAGYLASEDLDPVREFYRSRFRSGGWAVADASFSYDEWSFLVVRGEREARVELESRNGLTEVHLEATRPGSARPAPGPQDAPRGFQPQRAEDGLDDAVHEDD